VGIAADNIPSEKASQFVHACLKVVALIERREGELQAAETESESARIQQEIEAEAIAIIEQAGLTRQEYLQLLSLANVDPEFGERVAALLQEAVL
jgi:single-stranded DNA-specific DHH superfamily exonuclease